MSLTVPAIFKEAHRLRKHLRELQSEIDQGPRVQKIQQQKLNTEEAAHKEAHDLIGRLKLKIREDELNLKTVNTQLAKFEKQLNDAGSPKEYEAKQSEIRQAKEKIQGFEEAILATMEELERATTALPIADKQWATAQKDFAQEQVEAQERLARLLEEQKRAQEELAGFEVQLPADLRQTYDRLINRYGADGLAGLAGRTCQQCRTSITEQQKITLQSGKFFCCPNCGRVLYIAS